MKPMIQLFVGLFVALGMLGCGCPKGERITIARSAPAVLLSGFVDNPGRYPYRMGMTVADALSKAGGYRKCDSCMELYERCGWHPTFDWPPHVTREGRLIELPLAKSEWMNFPIHADDQIKFRHIAF